MMNMFFRCKIPGYDNDTWDIHSEEQEELVKRYIPPSDTYSYDRCHLYYYTNDSLLHSNGDVVLNASEIKCKEWVYDTSVFQTTFTKKVSIYICFNGNVKPLGQFEGHNKRYKMLKYIYRQRFSESIHLTKCSSLVVLEQKSYLNLHSPCMRCWYCIMLIKFKKDNVSSIRVDVL